MAESDAKELYRRYRPTTLQEIVGQKDALKVLTDMGKRGVMPHALLFSGPSGTGKTTMARIIARKLKCYDHDFAEINAASSRGIDSIRDIEMRMGISPMGGMCRVWLLDECHSLTSDAQTALLKLLEDTPPHVYFMLATTDPKKLKPTIVTRCTQITCKAVSVADLVSAITRVVIAEDKEIDKEVISKIADMANGSVRQALVTLHTVIGLPDKASQLSAIENADVTVLGFDIAKLLMNTKVSWTNVRDKLATVEEDPETIRRIIINYCKSALIKGWGDPGRAHLIIEEFREPLFDAGTASALLTSSCYALVNSR